MAEFIEEQIRKNGLRITLKLPEDNMPDIFECNLVYTPVAILDQFKYITFVIDANRSRLALASLLINLNALPKNIEKLKFAKVKSFENIIFRYRVILNGTFPNLKELEINHAHLYKSTIDHVKFPSLRRLVFNYFHPLHDKINISCYVEINNSRLDRVINLDDLPRCKLNNCYIKQPKEGYQISNSLIDSFEFNNCYPSIAYVKKDKLTIESDINYVYDLNSIPELTKNYRLMLHRKLKCNNLDPRIITLYVYNVRFSILNNRVQYIHFKQVLDIGDIKFNINEFKFLKKIRICLDHDCNFVEDFIKFLVYNSLLSRKLIIEIHGLTENSQIFENKLYNNRGKNKLSNLKLFLGKKKLNMNRI